MRVLPILPISQAARFPARRPPHLIAKEQAHDRDKKAERFRLTEPEPQIGDWIYGRPSR
jgi:hypothetical protein